MPLPRTAAVHVPLLATMLLASSCVQNTVVEYHQLPIPSPSPTVPPPDQPTPAPTEDPRNGYRVLTYFISQADGSNHTHPSVRPMTRPFSLALDMKDGNWSGMWVSSGSLDHLQFLYRDTRKLKSSVSVKLAGNQPEPLGLAFNPTGYILYTTLRTNHLVYKTYGNGSRYAGGLDLLGYVDGASSSARFQEPIGLAVDKSNNMYVADAKNNVIRQISPDGKTVMTLAGSPEFGFVDRKGTAARFDYPVGLALDRIGGLVVGDQNNHAIRRILPDREVVTIAGTGKKGHRDGPGKEAMFNFPHHVAVDAQGNVYVADSFNHCIRKITPDGFVSTIAGNPGKAGYTDGPAGQSLFDEPHGVALDSKGNLYVADTKNDCIRVIQEVGADPVVPAP